MKRRRPSQPPENAETTAQGRPAPFTEAEIEALRHGKFDEARLASILEAAKQPKAAEAGRPNKLAPVQIDERTLRALSEGSTPTALRAGMDKSAKKDRDAARSIDERQERPRKKPPR